MMFGTLVKKLRGRLSGGPALSTVLTSPCDPSLLQSVLLNQYRTMKYAASFSEMPKLSEVGFSVYSQFEEDGLLLYIFAIVGTTNRRVVEICAGDGIQCMSANLIIHHGWEGLLFDGDLEKVKRGKIFYAEKPGTWLCPPKFSHAWITAENVNELVTSNGFTGEVDLLSTDVDGNDYWISKALTCLNPRVIICETHNVIPSDLSLSIPYDPAFYIGKNSQHKEFTSASLLAFQKLYNERGYRLIGAHRYGFNALFMRNDVGIEHFPEVSVAAVHDNPCTRDVQRRIWPQIKHLPWQKV